MFIHIKCGAGTELGCEKKNLISFFCMIKNKWIGDRRAIKWNQCRLCHIVNILEIWLIPYSLFFIQCVRFHENLKFSLIRATASWKNSKTSFKCPGAGKKMNFARVHKMPKEKKYLNDIVIIVQFICELQFHKSS